MNNKNIISFDPKLKEIRSNTNDEFIIYSEWKRWVLTDTNSMYLAAFDLSNDKPILINNWKLISMY